MIVVCNSSPLIALSSINRLGLLDSLFQSILIPHAVYDEVVTQGKMKAGVYEVATANWIKRTAIRDESAALEVRKDHNIGRGESEAIALADQLHADWVIIDEARGRRAATQRGLKVVGTIGILLLSKKRGLIDNIQEVLDELIRSGFRISKRTYQIVLTMAGK